MRLGEIILYSLVLHFKNVVSWPKDRVPNSAGIREAIDEHRHSFYITTNSYPLQYSPLPYLCTAANVPSISSMKFLTTLPFLLQLHQQILLNTELLSGALSWCRIFESICHKSKLKTKWWKVVPEGSSTTICQYQPPAHVAAQ